MQTLGDDPGFTLAVFFDDSIDIANKARADEQRAIFAEHHRTRVGYAAGIQADLETRWQLDLVERNLVCG